MFTDATRVVINNKEVQSITTSNGGVIYNAYEPYHCFCDVGYQIELTITDLTTGQTIPVTPGEHDYCLLEIGHTYKFKATDTDRFSEWFIEETITYQSEGYYKLLVLKNEINLTFIEGPFNGITVNTDKSIIQIGETSNITVQVKENSFPANQKTVNIYKMED